MKQFKPLLPVGPTTAVERCIRLFQEAGVSDVRVVVGHHAVELQPVLDRLAVRSIMNDRFAEGMFSSVKAGVNDLNSDATAFFLLPVDIPLVRRGTILDLLAHRDVHFAGVWIPTFKGKRGHPPLIAVELREEILSWQGDGGLRGFLGKRSRQTYLVPVADEHISMDMDTPKDYRQLLAAVGEYYVPSADECVVLLTEKFKVQSTVMAHSTKVAQVALHVARALNERGFALSEKLIVAAALLHDLAKGQPDHAAVAALELSELGYPAVAEVVASHMDMEPCTNRPITPHEVVFFADKVVQADRIVPVEERFRRKLARCAQDKELSEKVARRFSHVTAVRERLEAALGSSIDAVISSNALSHRNDAYENLSLEAR
jgi:CTP:molybdopterin cytidylyltransferase MocA